MKFIEVEGRTIEDATNIGLKQLGKKKDEVDIKILEIPSKGFLGIIGSKQAKIKITVKDNPEKDVEQFLRKMFKAMELEVQIVTELADEVIKVYLEGPNMGVVIGRRGQTLDSIQYLASLVVNKEREKYLKVFIDTENYRQKREETLIKLANKIVYKVKKTRKSIALEPMNPYERRIIHAALQGHPAIQTYSEGEEPFRKVVIGPKK
ncbi:RNA-binding cell elongation regulator Jag/EloR [Serpentinicella alkaliphila]|uniref:RNA-binding protein KhpB n=1 Tax=Serpentinicella alkaliphila TaxID=1734049 RepID=A0A4R2THK9_9FIRM|nr:RNA-binding cell elongation regulator Jag/EloR [Serpentinicella alkaliphila]QUH25148.1 protein jag [Serpentinicella alkaliphila]TCQ02236.1 spoIIIJ-associated protein [Serpentinicella alkaliphila]